jgi:DNA-directed RNA polymerases I, II, and III subunit RPABC1
MEHSLVPKHEVISNKEKKQLLERYRIKDKHLPRIRCDDAIGKYIGLKPGKIVKITRKSETAGKYITYRLAV